MSIEAILERGRENDQLEGYLPEERDMERLPRMFIATIVRGLLKTDFDDWVDGVIDLRNENLKTKQSLEIELSPDIYKIYKESKMISSKQFIRLPSHLCSILTSNCECSSKWQGRPHDKSWFEETQNTSLDLGCLFSAAV